MKMNNHQLINTVIDLCKSYYQQQMVKTSLKDYVYESLLDKLIEQPTKEEYTLDRNEWQRINNDNFPPPPYEVTCTLNNSKQ